MPTCSVFRLGPAPPPPSLINPIWAPAFLLHKHKKPALCSASLLFPQIPCTPILVCVGYRWMVSRGWALSIPHWIFHSVLQTGFMNCILGDSFHFYTRDDKFLIESFWTHVWILVQVTRIMKFSTLLLGYCSTNKHSANKSAVWSFIRIPIERCTHQHHLNY